ncbi:uncharacterized protein LOC110043668 isoform X2 [Orbicella faveolata]|uniref:uncharacterized protein LOC110043668 isoform X2 n=1 Tax=Orbicella faveolata TaxID=48498 RepID=UPI0009E2D9D8|nr:uncharacterized protein LOC110043668 isoform X2 [Orbicella faveolata]
MESNSYRTFLLQISDHITEGKLRQLKYLCSDDIPEGDLEMIRSPLDLFRQLERREMIGIDNLSFLQQLLSDVTCVQLAKKVGDFISRREVELLCLKIQRGELRKIEGVPMAGDRQNHVLNHSLKEAAVVITSCNVTDGKHDEKITEVHPGRCSCFIHQSPNQRKQGEIYLRIALELATKGAWVAGTAFILKRYINEPETLVRLFTSVVLPSGILVKYLCEGSVICVLETNDMQGLKELWQKYESGKLQEALEEILITEELRELSAGQEIILTVELDENMYRDVCLELMMTKRKDQLLEGVKQRPRSLSDPVIKQLEKPENTFQQQSLHIVADTERRKRLEAEKKLKKLIAGQSLELRFPELQLYADKSFQDKTAHDGADESDDNSSTTSTLDEEEVLDWEDKHDLAKEFWISIKGSLKEKKWSDFLDAVRKASPDDLERGGTALIKFLAYVLHVNYAKGKLEIVNLQNYIRLTGWFGPFTKGPQGCLQKMTHLMENSASVDSDGKVVSWFAGYMKEQQAKEWLRNEKGGAFLIRFNTPTGFLLSKKSSDMDSVVEFAIEASVSVCFIHYESECMKELSLKKIQGTG